MIRKLNLDTDSRNVFGSDCAGDQTINQLP